MTAGCAHWCGTAASNVRRETSKVKGNCKALVLLACYLHWAPVAGVVDVEKGTAAGDEATANIVLYRGVFHERPGEGYGLCNLLPKPVSGKGLAGNDRNGKRVTGGRSHRISRQPLSHPGESRAVATVDAAAVESCCSRRRSDGAGNRIAGPCYPMPGHAVAGSTGFATGIPSAAAPREPGSGSTAR